MTSLKDPEQHTDQHDEEPSGGHSHWAMIACCIPMLAIAVLIALSGAGLGFLLVAVMCTAMMAMMMRGMTR